jgi:DNA-binding response OmpR family regulator
VKRILVIEDEPAIRSGMVRLLMLKGFNVYEAADGEIGLLLSEAIQPDLILCDINLPVFNGFVILRQVRRNSTTASIPFIILTSHTDQEVHQRSLELGASEFLSKPISPDELLTVVKHQLEVAASREQ